MPTQTPDYIELKTTAKTVSTNAEQILRENPKRRYLCIQNNGSAVAYIAFGDTLGPLVSSTTGFKVINAGEKEFLRDVNLSEQSVYATAASTNTALLITEGAYSGEFAPFDPPPAGASSSSSSSSSSSPSSESSSESSSDSSDSSSSSST